jgi:hypothetical protein
MLNNQKIRITTYAHNLFGHIHSFFLLADLMRLDTRVYTNERPFIIRSLYTSHRDARTYIEYIYSHLIKMR